MLDSVKPFLLVATRAEDAVADAEYDAFLRFGGLTKAQLIRVRLESAPLTELMPRLDLTDVSGVVIGGSPYTSSDPPEEKSPAQIRVEQEMEGLVGDVIKHDIPFLGACYGIGTLARHLGGVVDRTYGEPVSAVEISLTEQGRADPLLDGIPPAFLAFVGHKEALRDVPLGAVLLASSAGCPVQMFRVGENQYATQFHPELDVPGIVGRMRAYRDKGYFRSAELEPLIAEVSAEKVTWPASILANFVTRYART